MATRTIHAALGAALVAALAAMPWRAVDAAIVAMEVSIKFDKVAADQPGISVGDVHKACIFFDDAQIDPKTQRVVLLHETHAGGIPKHLNPREMPMHNSWLDLSATPLRLHYAAAPTAAFPVPYFVLFNEKTLRVTMYRQEDGAVLMGGDYTVDPNRIVGPAVAAVVATSDPVRPPWITEPQGFAPPSKAGPRPSGGPAPSACPAGTTSSDVQDAGVKRP